MTLCCCMRAWPERFAIGDQAVNCEGGLQLISYLEWRLMTWTFNIKHAISACNALDLVHTKGTAASLVHAIATCAEIYHCTVHAYLGWTASRTCQLIHTTARAIQGSQCTLTPGLTRCSPA